MSQKHHKKIRRLVREAEARVKAKKPEIVREAIDEVSAYPFFYRLKLATQFWWQIVRGRRTDAGIPVSDERVVKQTPQYNEYR